MLATNVGQTEVIMKDNIKVLLPKCHECDLRGEFENGNKQHSRYCSFGLYYSDQQAQSSKFVFLTQNPGVESSGSAHYRELERPPDGDYIPIMQQHYVNWLTKANSAFSRGFFEALRTQNLIDDYTDLQEYCRERFFSDFLVTDLVKCRASTTRIRDDHIKKCTEVYLSEELERYGSGKLIFAFSTRTWRYLYHHPRFKPYLVDAQATSPGAKHKDKVSKVHGMLFRSDALNAWFIPLAHFSQRQYNNYLRDSYFSYLEGGLTMYVNARR
jgi:hypothetical protein